MNGNGEDPFPLLTNHIYEWLDNALDYGISEFDFWNMTIGEIRRYVESQARVEKKRAQEKATFDYILADAIGRSISRIYSSSSKMPDLATLYPTLFDSKEIQEKKAQKKMELSALRFRLFATSHNNKVKEGAKVNE